jgi:transcriptional regulator with XRE-family HTH domain
MIHNEHERRVTTRKHAELTTTLNTRTTTPMPEGRDPEMHELVNAGIRTQLTELQAELDDYAALNAGDIPVDLPNLDNIGEQLIRARISAGLSQQQLADVVGLSEGTIRRFERERYASTALRTVQMITDQLKQASSARLCANELTAYYEKLGADFLANQSSADDVSSEELASAFPRLVQEIMNGHLQTSSTQPESPADDLALVNAVNEQSITSVVPFESVVWEAPGAKTDLLRMLKPRGIANDGSVLTAERLKTSAIVQDHLRKAHSQQALQQLQSEQLDALEHLVSVAERFGVDNDLQRALIRSVMDEFVRLCDQVRMDFVRQTQ